MRLSRLTSLVFICAAVGCAPPPATKAVHASPSEMSGQRPKRIVSLDYCADQYVLKLADRTDIAALSPDATGEFSYMRDRAVGIRKIRPTMEDVLALNPDLVVRSYGGGPNATAFLKRAGVKVHEIGWGDDFDAVRTNTKDAAAAIGQTAKGNAVVEDFDRRLAALVPAKGVTALYMTAGGVTTGSGSMIDLMMTTAGLTNFQTQPGWNPIPLERLTTQRPDMVAAAFFRTGVKTGAERGDYWSSSRHPIAQRVLRDLPVSELEGATTSCAGWFVMDAIEALAATGRTISKSNEQKVSP